MDASEGGRGGGREWGSSHWLSPRLQQRLLSFPECLILAVSTAQWVPRERARVPELTHDKDHNLLPAECVIRAALQPQPRPRLPIPSVGRQLQELCSSSLNVDTIPQCEQLTPLPPFAAHQMPSSSLHLSPSGPGPACSHPPTPTSCAAPILWPPAE